MRVSGPVATEWMSFAQAYAGPAPAAGRVASMTRPAGAHRQLLGLLRRPARRRPRDGRGGPIDVLTGDYLAELTMLILAKAQAKDPAPRLRADLPHPGRGRARHVPRARHQDRLQRGRAQPGRARGGDPHWPRARAARGRLRRRRRPARRRSPRSPRRSAASRCRPTPTSAAGASPRRWGRAPTSSSPAGSPTPRSSSDRPRGGTAGAATDWDALAGRGRRRARDRVRAAGHGRQLRVPRRDHRPALPGLPDRRGRRGRLVGDHEAPGHRRARLGRHGHRAAALRDRRARVPRPGRHRALRHHRAGAGRRAPRRDHRGARERRRPPR